MSDSSFAGLAKRTSWWTTNLLASGLVVVIVIGLGRQYLNWGRDEAAPPAARPAADDSPLFDLPSGVTFGSGGLSRQEFQGTRQAAVHRLTSIARDAAIGARGRAAAPSAAEAKVLALAVRREPVEVDPAGRWRIFHFDGAFPFVAAVSGAETAGEGKDKRSLAAWGVAVPAGEGRWSLYVQSGDDEDSPAASTAVALPAGARRALSLRSAGGGEVTAFHGDGSPAAWKKFFDADLPRRGYARDADWTYFSGIWHARYRSGSHAGGTLDVQFSATEDGRLRGLLTSSQ